MLACFDEIKFIKSGSTSENSLFEYVKIIFVLSLTHSLLFLSLTLCITIALLLCLFIVIVDRSFIVVDVVWLVCFDFADLNSNKTEHTEKSQFFSSLRAVKTENLFHKFTESFVSFVRCLLLILILFCCSDSEFFLLFESIRKKNYTHLSSHSGPSIYFSFFTLDAVVGAFILIARRNINKINGNLCAECCLGALKANFSKSACCFQISFSFGMV